MPFKVSDYSANLSSFGRRGAQLDLSGADVTLAANVKAVQVIGAGTLIYSPVSDPGNWITVTGAPVGYQPAHVVGVVRSAANGTTAAVCTIAD